jgi:hypothetical protein
MRPQYRSISFASQWNEGECRNANHIPTESLLDCFFEGRNIFSRYHSAGILRRDYIGSCLQPTPKEESVALLVFLGFRFWLKSTGPVFYEEGEYAQKSDEKCVHKMGLIQPSRTKFVERRWLEKPYFGLSK